MVEVFKTNVHKASQAKEVLMRLLELYPHYKMNFDLDDCDRILRVEGENINPETIINTLLELQYNCEVLPD